MIDKFSENMVSKYVDALTKELGTLFDDLYDETEQFININIRKYLSNYQEKYSKIKTLLHGSTPLNLYDVYYHIDIKGKNPKTRRTKIVKTASIKNVLKESSKITIIGDAGSGKSTLVKHLFLNSLEKKVGIPILIELRYFNQSKENLITYLKREISDTDLVVNSEILERYLDKGKFIFFLDGYDELNSEIIQKVIKDLNSFMKKYENNKFILTTRPYSNIEMLSEFHNFEICDLENTDVENFIKLQLGEKNELAVKMIKSINENRNKKYIGSFLKNPLLLSLYILTFQSNSSIPDKKYIFYRRVVNALFSEHDSKTKLGYRRQKKSKLSQEDFEEIIKRFSFLSYFSNKFNFDEDYIINLFGQIKEKLQDVSFTNRDLIDDLLLSVALWLEDGGNYSFAHRSIQEYFATLFIIGLNEKNKKAIYNKIIRDYGRNRFNEIENLMSLCKEMDIINFTKFLHIPTLKKIQEYFNKNENSSNLKNYLTFLFDGFHVRYNHDSEKIIDSSHHASSYAISVYNTIQEEIIGDNGNFVLQYCNYKTETEGKEDDSRFVKYIKANNLVTSEMKSGLSNEVNLIIEDIIDFFDTKEINSRALQFKNYVSERIEELEKFVKTSEESDKELLSMI